MVERGDATAEDVDTAMELGAGYRKSASRLDHESANIPAMGVRLAIVTDGKS